MVHPKGHIMARIEDLFFRTAVVSEGAVVGDSQAVERVQKSPRGPKSTSQTFLAALLDCTIPQSCVNGSSCGGNGPFSKAVAAAALLCGSSISAPPGTWGPWSGCLLCLVRTLRGVWGKHLSEG